MDNQLKKQTPILKILYWIIAVLPILLVIYAYIHPIPFLGSQEEIRSAVSKTGSIGFVIFILIQIFQVVVTPINHYAVGLVGGYIYGTWIGFILNWIGRVIGTIIAFYLARKIGRPILNNLVKPTTMHKFDWLFNHPTSGLLLFIVYFLPGFPDDEIAYITGASTMSFRRFLLVILLGHVGGSLGLAYIGSGISTKDPMFYVLSFVSVVLIVLFFFHWRRLQKEHKEKEAQK